MTPLMAGIKSLYDGSATLKAAMTGGLFLELAPQGTARPYGVYQIIIARPDYFFTKVQEIVTVQFDIFASSSSVRTDIYNKLTAVYDDARPTATGYTSIIMERKNQMLLREGDQNQIFRAMVEYEAIIEKAN